MPKSQLEEDLNEKDARETKKLRTETPTMHLLQELENWPRKTKERSMFFGGMSKVKAPMFFKDFSSIKHELMPKDVMAEYNYSNKAGRKKIIDRVMDDLSVKYPADTFLMAKADGKVQEIDFVGNGSVRRVIGNHFWHGMKKINDESINEYKPQQLQQQKPKRKQQKQLHDVCSNALSERPMKDASANDTPLDPEALPVVEGKLISLFAKKDIEAMPVSFAFHLGDILSEQHADALQRQWDESLKLVSSKRVAAKLVKTEQAPNLPDGWILRHFARQSGKTKGTTDRYWFSPKTGKRFRSMVELKVFMESLEEVGGDEDLAYALFKKKRGR